MTTSPVTTLTDELLAEIEGQSLECSKKRIPMVVNPFDVAVLLEDLRTLRSNSAALIKTLVDVKWRIEDTSSQLTARRFGGEETMYGLDEWSVPIVNLSRASNIIEKALLIKE